jgi:hypothetical protein
MLMKKDGSEILFSSMLTRQGGYKDLINMINMYQYLLPDGVFHFILVNLFPVDPLNVDRMS